MFYFYAFIFDNQYAIIIQFFKEALVNRLDTSLDK